MDGYGGGAVCLGGGVPVRVGGLAAGADLGLRVGVGRGAGRWAGPVGALRWACSSPPWVSGMVSEASGVGWCPLLARGWWRRGGKVGRAPYYTKCITSFSIIS